MLVVPENKVTRLLHLSHYITVNQILMYTNVDTLYKFMKFQKDVNKIINHFDKHNKWLYQ